MSSQPDEVDCLAGHNFVAGVDLLVPGLRRVVVENRHPAFGELEVVEVADELRGRFGRREVALHLELHGLPAVFFAATFLVATFLMVDFFVAFFLAGEVFVLPPFALGATAAALPRYVIFK